MLGMRFLFCTVLMAVVYFIMALVIIRIFTPAVIFGEGLCAFLCSYLLSNILLMCQERAEEADGSAGTPDDFPESHETVEKEFS